MEARVCDRCKQGRRPVKKYTVVMVRAGEQTGLELAKPELCDDHAAGLGRMIERYCNAPESKGDTV